VVVEWVLAGWHGGDKKNGTPRPNWATPRNAHKSSTFSISSLFAPHLAVVFTHLFSMSSPTHHEIEEIEKVDDLCAFRGVAQLGLGVPFFLSPPWVVIVLFMLCGLWASQASINGPFASASEFTAPTTHYDCTSLRYLPILIGCEND